MKKTFLFAAAMVVAGSLFAQTPERKNNIKVNLLSPLVNTFSGFYERKVSPVSTLQLGLLYTGYNFDGSKLKGFAITPEYRYYASDKGAMQGFYVAPFLRYQNYTISDSFSESTLNSFGGGLLVGNQWMFKKGINLDVFVGPSYSGGSVKHKSGTDDVSTPWGVNGFGIRGGLTLGIAF